MSDKEQSVEDFFSVPKEFNEEEAKVWNEIVQMLKESSTYKKFKADSELLKQYCQIKIMRDRAWREWNNNPERYIRIVTGICQDGKTPKVLVKENEHYKILIDCNKQLERLLKELRLTPQARKPKYF